MATKNNHKSLDDSIISENEGKERSGTEMETANSSESDTAEENNLSNRMAATIALSIEKVLSKKLDSRLDKFEGMIAGTIAQQNQKIEELTESYNDLQSQYSKLLRDYDFLYKEVHKRNIVLRGISDEDVENDVLARKVEKLLSDMTKTIIVVDEVYRIGKYLPDQCRVICVSLISMKDKHAIMKKKAEFKKMDPPCDVCSDLPKSMRIAHALLFNKRKELQDSGSDGEICFKTYSIRASNGEIFDVKNGKLHKREKKSLARKGVKRSSFENSEDESINNEDRKVKKPKKIKAGSGGPQKEAGVYDFRRTVRRNSIQSGQSVEPQK